MNNKILLDCFSDISRLREGYTKEVRVRIRALTRMEAMMYLHDHMDRMGIFIWKPLKPLEEIKPGIWETIIHY